MLCNLILKYHFSIVIFSFLLIMPIFISSVQAQSEMPDPDESCVLVDECLSPDEQIGSRVIYYIFVILIGLLLLAILVISFLLYKSTIQKQN